MKKFFLTLSALTTLLLAGCTEAPTPEVTDSPAVGWEWFTHEEAGLRFMHTGGTIHEYRQIDGIDQGQMLGLWTGDHGFEMVLFSDDFAPGVNSGCCHHLTGTPVDLSMDARDVLLRLGSQSYYSEPELITANGQDMLYFYRMNWYVDGRLVPSVILPYEHEIYSNVLITGPVLFTTPVFDADYSHSDDMVEMAAFVEGMPDNLDSDQVSALGIFERMVRSLELL